MQITYICDLMNWKSGFIYLATIALIASGVFFGYRYYEEHKPDEVFTIVPSSAFVIGSFNQTDSDSISAFNVPQLDGLQTVMAMLQEKGIDSYHYSLHKESEEIDWVFYIHESTEFDDAWFETVRIKEERVLSEQVDPYFILTSNQTLLTKITAGEGLLPFSESSSKAQELNLFPVSTTAADSTILFDRLLSDFLSWESSIEIDYADQDVLFNGDLSLSNESSPLVYLADNQKSNDLALQHVLPNVAPYVFYFNISNGLLFQEGLRKYDFQRTGGELDKLWVDFNKSGKSNIEDLFLLFEGMGGITEFEFNSEMQRVAFLPFDDPEKDAALFLEFLQNATSDSLEQLGQFEGRIIYRSPESDLYQLILADFAPELENTYFTFIDSYLVFSNSPVGLRKILLDVSNDNVWGRSIDEAVKIEKYTSATNIGLYIPDLKAPLLKVKSWPYPVLEFGEVLAYQIIADGGQYFVSGQIGSYTSDFNSALAVAEEVNEQENKSLELKAKIISKPYLVMNHSIGKFDILVQDSNYVLHMIGQDGSKRWTKQIGGPIVEDVKQLDLYKNGKIQYLVATENRVYCFDRLGRSVEDYPFQLPNRDTIYSYSLVDYNNTKDYRFFFGSSGNKIYLTNTKGKALGNWDPLKATKTPLSSSPRHVRVKGKDYMVALEQNGTLNVWRRNTDDIPHFPIKTGKPSLTKLFIEKGNQFDNTFFTFITSDHNLLKYNLYGEQKLKKVLDNAAIDYQIIPVVGKNSFLIAAWKGNSLILFDDEGEVINVIPGLVPTKTIQCYDIEGSRFILVLDNKSSKMKMYGAKEAGLSKLEFDASEEVSILKLKGKKVRVFSVTDNEITIFDEEF